MKSYLFKGQRYTARNKEDLLRRLKLNIYDKRNKAMVTQIKKAGG